MDCDAAMVGLADALISRFSKVRQLVVRPTSSVLRFEIGETDSFAAGSELKVRFVLDGNFVRADRRIRVSVQLLDVVKRSIVWAERFDERSTDVLTLEDRISQRVAASIVPQLSAGEAHNLTRRPTDNADAYEAYLRGRYHWNTFTEDGLRQAINYLQQAVRLDPDYALAHAAIADYYVWHCRLLCLARNVRSAAGRRILSVRHRIGAARDQTRSELVRSPRRAWISRTLRQFRLERKRKTNAPRGRTQSE